MGGMFPLSCATSSLNPFPASKEPPHDLISKVRAISHAGFSAIELAFPDLLSFAAQRFGREVSGDAWDELCIAAKNIRGECDLLGLRIMMLQPFSNFEGWQKGSPEKEDAFQRAEGWIRIMIDLGTNMLQVGSTDAPSIVRDKQALANDLAELADMLAVHNLRLAYENWCWATVAPTWRDVYEIVELANRTNIGLCLDTFQTAGYEWGDPTEPSGRLSHISQSELADQYASSLRDLSKTVPKDKIYLLQISDAYLPPSPLSKNGLRPRGEWSSAFRHMPGTDGYLPVVEVAKAVMKTGFRGWFSVEIFDGGKDGHGRRKGDLISEATEIMRLTTQFVDDVVKD
ncbi:MAG: hypothetical protein M1825_001160 [Sarcosagium campestre]|nr:MAG: hypothetical protein M1825_001160 [Sarcosagium campestre]